MRGWKRLQLSGETPCARSGAASAVISDTMYMFGGFGGSMRLNDLHSFSFESRLWTKLNTFGDIPSSRENIGMVSLENKLYLFGGFNGTEWLNDFYEFDIDSHLWTRLPKTTSSSSLSETEANPTANPSTAPSPRFGFVSCVYNKKIIIFGGFDGQQWLDDLFVYDISTQTWSLVTQYGRIPSPRSCPSWSVQGNIALVFGGFNGNNRMNDLHMLMLDTYCWTEIESFGNVPSARYFHGSAIHDNTLYVFGGYDGSERLSDMSALNLINRVWKSVSLTSPDTGSSLSSGINLMVSQGGAEGGVVVNCTLAEIMANSNPTMLINNENEEPCAAGSSVSSSGYMLTNTHFTISNSLRNSSQITSRSNISGVNQTGDLAGEGSLSQLDPSSSQSLHPMNSAYYNSQSQQIPGGRSSFVAQSSDNVMIVFGGYNGSEVLDELWEFRYFAISIPTPTLTYDMRKLVNHDDFYDVTFEVEGKEIHAHRAILAIRSDHFRALLYGGMKETSSNKIVIEHTSHGAFYRLVHFLYTDELIHDGNFDVLFELLSLADTYILFRLKRMCEDRIVRGIAIDNVCPMLLAGHRLRAEALKEQCLAFLLENLDRVKQNESFSVLKEEPDLLLHIIMRQSTCTSPVPISPSNRQIRDTQTSSPSRSTSWLSSRLNRHGNQSSTQGNISARQAFLDNNARTGQYDRSVGTPARNPPPVPLFHPTRARSVRSDEAVAVSSPNQATMSLSNSTTPQWTARRVLPVQINNRQDVVDFQLNNSSNHHHHSHNRWGLALLGTDEEPNIGRDNIASRPIRRIDLNDVDDDDDDDSDVDVLQLRDQDGSGGGAGNSDAPYMSRGNGGL